MVWDTESLGAPLEACEAVLKLKAGSKRGEGGREDVGKYMLGCILCSRGVWTILS